MSDTVDDSDDETEMNGFVNIDPDGREAHIDIGYYSVSVSGDPGDSIEDVTDAVMDLADRAKADAQEMDERIDENGDKRTYS